MKLSNQFFESLEQTITESFSPLSYVNYGGCGWAALTMSRALRRVGIDAQVYFVNYYQTEHLYEEYGNNFIEACNQVISEGRGYVIPNNHIVISVNGIYYDSDGLVDPDCIDHSTRTPLPLLKQMLKHASWNSKFEYMNNDNPVTKQMVELNLIKSIEQLVNSYKVKA